jgi:hypothetical protein
MIRSTAVAIFALLLGCSLEPRMPAANLDGVWVEMGSKSDTLEINVREATMSLKRGNEMLNGQWLPKHGSGPYGFKILPDHEIALQWLLSSVASSQVYYFELSGNQFHIGNFFAVANPSNRLTFEKIK